MESLPSQMVLPTAFAEIEIIKGNSAYDGKKSVSAYEPTSGTAKTFSVEKGVAMDTCRGEEDIPFESEGDGEMSWKDGVAASYAANDGIKLSAREMNIIGLRGSLSSFYGSRGFRATYDATIANAMGGYPKGCILLAPRGVLNDAVGDESAVTKWCEVVSLQDDNRKNFLDGSYKIGEKVDGKVWWAYAVSRKSISLRPDFTTKRLMHEAHVEPKPIHGTRGGETVITGYTPFKYRFHLNKGGWILTEFESDRPNRSAYDYSVGVSLQRGNLHYCPGGVLSEQYCTCSVPGTFRFYHMEACRG